MRILISGSGIAGPTLAYWLRQHGFTPTIIEAAPAPRMGGYAIDFWGAGYDIAERMGLIPELSDHGLHMEEVRMVGRDGRRTSGFSSRVLDRMMHGRYLTIARAQLAASLHGQIAGRVETIFGDSVAAIDDAGAEVRVRFLHGEPRAFDLVIGADGLHSNIRAHVFGAQAQFEKYLGYKVAAFDVAGYRPRDELVYVLYTQVNQQVARLAMRDDRTMFLFVYADDDPGGPEPHDVAAQKGLIKQRYAASGWECPQILEAMDSAETWYFDRVSQIRMPRWTQGRVALVGDAAFCVSLVAGQGSALAMVAAYVLAGELKAAAGDHSSAFARYHERLASFIAAKQAAAERFAALFAPRSRFRLFVRNYGSKLIALPFVAKLAFGRGLVDRIELPTY